jgi:hypothetical protein
MLVTAGILSIVVGLIHSVLGEVLIFKRLHKGAIVPTIGKSLLQKSNVRILWATWRIATLFGWTMGLIILRLSQINLDPVLTQFVIQCISVSMFASGLLVFIATKANTQGD